MNPTEDTKNEFLITNFIVEKKGGFFTHKRAGLDKEKDITVYLPAPIEVKTDWDAEKTGNVFLECYNCRQNKPSGLYVTKAVFWCHFVPPNHLFLFRPAEMRRQLENVPKNAVGYRWMERCGDDNSNGWVVSIANLRLLTFVTKYTTDFRLQRLVEDSTPVRAAIRLGPV